MEVRPASADDVPGIRAVAKESWSADYPESLNRENVDEAVDEWYATEALEGEIARSGSVVLVAEVDGEVAGFAHALWNHDEGDIFRVYVDPQHRGRGLGTRLLEATREELVDRGVDRLVAMVLADNDVGNEFYRSFGFERVDADETTIAGETYTENRYVLEL